MKKQNACASTSNNLCETFLCDFTKHRQLEFDTYLITRRAIRAKLEQVHSGARPLDAARASCSCLKKAHCYLPFTEKIKNIKKNGDLGFTLPHSIRATWIGTNFDSTHRQPIKTHWLT